MEKSQNYVELWGTAGAAPSFSHENHGESFYRFPLRVERLSGQSDLPLILAPSTLLEGTDIAEGTPLRVTGQLRSFNNRSGHGSRLVISTFAQSIEPCDGGHFNRILLSGVLCKQPTLRRTPLGRSICDMILAVNRRYVDFRVGIQIVMPIRTDSGGNERKLSASAKLCKDVLADIFIRKRDKAADKGLLQLVQHDLLIVQLQFSLIRIDISEPEAGKVVRYKIQSFSGMLRILFCDRRVLHNKAQLRQCCQIRRY